MPDAARGRRRTRRTSSPAGGVRRRGRGAARAPTSWAGLAARAIRCARPRTGRLRVGSTPRSRAEAAASAGMSMKRPRVPSSMAPPAKTTEPASGPRDVLRRVVQQACLTVGADQAFVALRDAREPSQLVVAAAYGGDAEELAGRRFTTDEGLAGRVVAEGTPLLLGPGRFAREQAGGGIRAGA